MGFEIALGLFRGHIELCGGYIGTYRDSGDFEGLVFGERITVLGHFGVYISSKLDREKTANIEQHYVRSMLQRDVLLVQLGFL